MAKILGFAGSNSSRSINKQLVAYTLQQCADHDTVLLDLNDFEMPLYGIDYEEQHGIPEQAIAFKEHIKQADAIIVSFAEHNGSYAVAAKNVIDWCSRLEGKLWEEKPMLIMATSPGGRGGITVLDAAAGRFPFMGGQVVSQFSLPSFSQNFHPDQGIINEELAQSHREALTALKASL